MEEIEILKGILNSYPYFIVFVDNDYIIRFMNKPAQDHYLKKGKNLIGKSIFDCHNEKSIEKIKKNYEQIKTTGKDVFIFVNSKNQRVYMQGVKNEKGEWIGFIERFELNLQM
ncbi:MAG: PAS domain-containing protein [Clostridia bacterium]|nr:PAS domain-containing protein [Clostridia bacterium]